MKVKSESEVAQSCPTLRDLMDCSLPGSSIHGIFQAGVLEWGAIAFSITKFLDFAIFPAVYSSHSQRKERLYRLQTTRLLCPWDSPDKNIGVGCHYLYQGIFPTQGSKPSLPHCRQIFLPSEPPESLLFYIPTCTAKSFQSCLTLCDPIDGSPPGSPIPGILQARTLEWAAISFSNA